jgi:hypothetical protein
MTRFIQFARVICIGLALSFGLLGCGGGASGGNHYEVPVTPPVVTNPAGEIRVDSIKSAQADTTYNLHVYLPSGYDATKAYPIIYALDGDSNYTTIAGQLDNLQIKAIMVAIGRDDLRTRDYNLPGAYSYYKFVTLDLIPYIEAKYKVPQTSARSKAIRLVACLWALRYSWTVRAAVTSATLSRKRAPTT